MKLTVKPLKGSPFPIEVETTLMVKDVKDMIEKEKGWETGCQKLIHAGKIMADDKPLSEYKVQEGGFIVCMVTKTKKPAESAAETTSTPAPAAATPAPAATSTTTTTPAPAAATPAPAAATPAPAAAAPSAAAPSGGSNPFSGPEFESGVSQLQEMGFPETECRAALRAAFGDTSRAVEFLMSGIPPEAAAAAAAQASGAGAPAAATPRPPQQQASAPAAAAAGDPLAALRSHPQLNNLKRTIQADPSSLQGVLQQIGASNPTLLQAINANQGAFVELMNEPIDESAGANEDAGDDAGDDAFGADAMDLGGSPNPEQFAAVLQAMQSMSPEQRSQLAQAMGVDPQQLQAITQMMQAMPPEAMSQMLGSMMQGGGGGGGGGGPPGGAVVHLTQEEAAAVDRLAELGFPKSACVEAYLACDKDEQLAANYLFSNPPDDPMDESKQ